MHIRLSKNFTLRELLWSDTAARNPNLIEKQLSPPDSVIHSLDYLTTAVLQPLRDELDWPIRISSGYRCADLNELIGGSERSQHVVGEAADIQIADPAGFMTSDDTLEVRALSRMLYRRATRQHFPRDCHPNFYLFVMVGLSLEDWDVDQLIHEYGDSWGRPSWVHVAASVAKDARRITVVGPYTNGYQHYESIAHAVDIWQEAGS